MEIPYQDPRESNFGPGTIGLKLLGATALVIAGVWPSRARAQAQARKGENNI